MKFLFKLFVIILIIGVIATVAGFAMIDFDVNKLAAYTIGDDDFELIEQSFDSIFDSIDITLSNNVIIVGKSQDEKIHISYYKNEDCNKISHNDDNNKLTVTTDKTNWLDSLFRPRVFSDKVITFELLLPSSFDKILNLVTSNGVITVSEQDVQELDVKTSNGVINIDKVTANQMTLNTSNGAVKIKECRIEKMLYAKTSNGVIEVKDTTANEIELLSSNGEIEGLSVQANDIKVRTANGKIKLLLTGDQHDYFIDYGTSNGSCHIDGIKTNKKGSINGNAAKKVYVKTSNGEIQIDFD